MDRRDMADEIMKVCSEIENMLLSKNASYGNSAANPINIFSNATAIEQINVRIDDKLNRLARGHEFSGEDTEIDLIGYLILKRCVQNLLIDDIKQDIEAHIEERWEDVYVDDSAKVSEDIPVGPSNHTRLVERRSRNNRKDRRQSVPFWTRKRRGCLREQGPDPEPASTRQSVCPCGETRYSGKE